MTSPTLEIVIPYYGDFGFLQEAVLSVVGQTDDDWLLTVIEDGDQGHGVGTWLNDLRDPRVRHVCNEGTLGVSANFQRCLEQATRDFVTFLGCDDRLKPGYVETVRQALRTEPTVSLVQPAVQVIDERGLPHTPLADRIKTRLTPHASDNVILSGDRLLASLMVGNWTYFPSLAWRRDALQRVGFRPELLVTVDLAALSSLIFEGASLLLLKDPLFEYRRHSQSVSSVAAVSSRRFQEERRVLNELARRANAHGWQRSALAARLRLTSRAHAAAQLPKVARIGDWNAFWACVRHALGP